ncbi:hypothetical protein [Actinoplanes sp. NPDC048796]|uniref:hypothetical protein n=1 Tax=Actinoplanes sp. NPDC048796 TaxID=3155640 RepID=UPI0034000518
MATTDADQERSRTAVDWSMFVSLAGGVTTVLSSVTNGPPLLTTLSLGGALFSAPFLVFRLAEKARGRHASPSRLPILVTVFLYTGVLTLLLVPTTQSYVFYDILGFSGGPRVVGADVVIPPGQSSDRGDEPKQRIRITIQNPDKNAQYASLLELSANWLEGPESCKAPGRDINVRYTVQSVINETGGASNRISFKGVAAESVEAASGTPSARGPDVPVAGTLSAFGNRCDDGIRRTLTLQLGIQTPLAANSFAEVDLDFPATLSGATMKFPLDFRGAELEVSIKLSSGRERVIHN